MNRDNSYVIGALLAISTLAAGLAPSLTSGAGAAVAVDDDAGPQTSTMKVGRDYKVVREDGRRLSVPIKDPDVDLPDLASRTKAPGGEAPGAATTERSEQVLQVPQGKDMAYAGTADVNSSTSTSRYSTSSGGASDRKIARVVADGTWSFYMNPRVLSTSKATYIGTTTSDGGIEATRLSNAHHRMDHVRVDTLDASVKRARYENGTYNAGVMDDHASPTFLQTPDGRMAMFWSGHATTPVYYRVSRTADSIKTFGPKQVLKGSGLESRMSTYTQLHHMRGESYPYWLMTRSKGADGRHDWYLTRSRDLKVWTPAIQLFKNPYPKPADAKEGETSTRGWPYLKISSDGDRTVDFAVTDGDTVWLKTNSQYHIRYSKGIFYKSDGTRIRSLGDVSGYGSREANPIDPREGTLIYSGYGPEGRARVYDIQRGTDGQLSVGMTTNDYTQQSYSFKWFTLQGGSWIGSTLMRGSEWPYGFELAYGNPSHVYAVNNVDGSKGKVQEWWTDNQGSSWQWRDVTPTVKDTYRNPVVPWSPRPAQYGPAASTASVFWNSGAWNYYDDFRQGIEMETTYDAPVWLSRNVDLTSRRGYARVYGKTRQGYGGSAAAGVSMKATYIYPSRSTFGTRVFRFKSSSTGYYSWRAAAPRGTKIIVETVPSNGWGWAKATTYTVR